LIGMAESTVSSPGEAAEDGRLRTGRRTRELLARYGLLIVFVLVMIVFKSLQWDVFLTADNLRRTILSPTGFAPLMILASGLTVVLAMGDFDLSFGNMVGLAGGTAVALMVNFDQVWPIAILAALAIGVAVGIANGFFVAHLGASSFVITLATATILLGLETLWTGNRSIIGVDSGFYLGLDETVVVWQLRTPIFIALGIALLTWLILDKTELGRYMYAIGGNREAARLAGIPVARIRMIGFIFVGVFSAVVGILLTANLGGMRIDLGTPLLLDAYAAVFLGAAVFRPGQFNIPGTILGVCFLRVVEVGLLVQRIENSWINVSKGGILLFGVLLSQLVGRRQ
jgi:ribose transport system permease protein